MRNSFVRMDHQERWDHKDESEYCREWHHKNPNGWKHQWDHQLPLFCVGIRTRIELGRAFWARIILLAVVHVVAAGVACEWWDVLLDVHWFDYACALNGNKAKLSENYFGFIWWSWSERCTRLLCDVCDAGERVYCAYFSDSQSDSQIEETCHSWKYKY